MTITDMLPYIISIASLAFSTFSFLDKKYNKLEDRVRAIEIASATTSANIQEILNILKKEGL